MGAAGDGVQRLFFELLVPNPAHLLEAIDVPAVTTSGIPTADILSEDDRELARPGAEFAARLGLHR